MVGEKSFVKKMTRVELGEDHSSLKRKANVAFFSLSHYAICIRFTTQNIFTRVCLLLLSSICDYKFSFYENCEQLFTAECQKTSGYCKKNYICQEPTAVDDSSKSK